MFLMFLPDTLIFILVWHLKRKEKLEVLLIREARYVRVNNASWLAATGTGLRHCLRSISLGCVVWRCSSSARLWVLRLLRSQRHEIRCLGEVQTPGQLRSKATRKRHQKSNDVLWWFSVACTVVVPWRLGFSPNSSYTVPPKSSIKWRYVFISLSPVLSVIYVFTPGKPWWWIKNQSRLKCYSFSSGHLKLTGNICAHQIPATLPFPIDVPHTFNKAYIQRLLVHRLITRFAWWFSTKNSLHLSRKADVLEGSSESSPLLWMPKCWKYLKVLKGLQLLNTLLNFCFFIHVDG